MFGKVSMQTMEVSFVKNKTQNLTRLNTWLIFDTPQRVSGGCLDICGMCLFSGQISLS